MQMEETRTHRGSTDVEPCCTSHRRSLQESMEVNLPQWHLVMVVLYLVLLWEQQVLKGNSLFHHCTLRTAILHTVNHVVLDLSHPHTPGLVPTLTLLCSITGEQFDDCSTPEPKKGLLHCVVVQDSQNILGCLGNKEIRWSEIICHLL